MQLPRGVSAAVVAVASPREGISVSGFEALSQLALFPARSASRVDSLLDAALKRFGDGALTRASLLGKLGAKRRPRRD